MNIYICSKKIVSQDVLVYYVMSDAISLIGKLITFLRESKEIDCADGSGNIDLEQNKGSIHFAIFGKDRRKFISQISLFCSDKKIFLFNAADKSYLAEMESIFHIRNRKTKEYIDILKDEYDAHRANWDIPEMANCIKNAEAIISGNTKVY